MLISSIKLNSYNNNQINNKNTSKPQYTNFLGLKKLQPIDTNAFKKDVPLTKYDDVFLSINKGIDKTKIKLTTKNDTPLIKANFDKDGQMIVGDMGEFHFERTNKNKRTLATPYGTYKPHGYNDKEWGLSDNLLRFEECKDNPIFELFLELTRLYTSIFK